VARKVALVTGSSHGIGQAIAIRLARNGYDVGVTYRSRKSGALDTFNAVVEAGARCEVMQVDISDLDSDRCHVRFLSGSVWAPRSAGE
jgi:NAD(P)-dependent dehydrogenase (short-subunit alcohol dehydrogenase family)